MLQSRRVKRRGRRRITRKARSMKGGAKVWSHNLSKKHVDRYYLYDDLTKKSRWDAPKVAIIVPFRDTVPVTDITRIESSRQMQRDRFTEYMLQFMKDGYHELHMNANFTIYFIEQTDDKRKFNRGKLLNIGFEIAKKDGCENFIFHDVDLLPSKELFPFYYNQFTGPMHIASVWKNRYENSKSYLGGITSFTAPQFEALNGFPNNYWGWGGEDDELLRRVKDVKMVTENPNVGTITDMENMNLRNKIATLKKNIRQMCYNKDELKAEHASWKENGLFNLDYENSTIERTDSKHLVNVKVDIKLNSHWTDNVSGVDDDQMVK